MYTCASCTLKSCTRGERENLPRNCPMREEPFFEEMLVKYDEPDNRAFYICSAGVESAGYGVWPRLKETVEFCKRMGYQKVGIAFCSGLADEARVIDGVFRKHGLETVSVICKTGGVSKERAGIPEECKLHPGQFEAMCNPIAQAALLDGQGVEFIVAVGLCVGHDSFLYKYAKAPVTTLIAKDRALAHNPVGAVYCANSYQKTILEP